MTQSSSALVLAAVLLLVTACVHDPSSSPPVQAPTAAVADRSSPARPGATEPQARNPDSSAPSTASPTAPDASPITGRLAPEEIQRVVRAHFDEMRKCYEDGLRADASLKGRVKVKFVIDRAGAVATAGDGGSDMPDPKVTACVVHVYAGLTFPRPEGGIVTVVYPIQFNPGD